MLTTGAFGGYRTVKVLVTSSSLVDNVECWPTQLLRENLTISNLNIFRNGKASVASMVESSWLYLNGILLSLEIGDILKTVLVVTRPVSEPSSYVSLNYHEKLISAQFCVKSATKETHCWFIISYLRWSYKVVCSISFEDKLSTRSCVKHLTCDLEFITCLHLTFKRG